MTEKQQQILDEIVEEGRNPVMFFADCQPAADTFCAIIRHLHDNCTRQRVANRYARMQLAKSESNPYVATAERILKDAYLYRELTK